MKKKWQYPQTQILRAALFGCGQVSQYHLRAWQQVENVQIVALANRTIAKAYPLADQFGIAREHVYGNHLDLLQHEKLDFVDIATAPNVHSSQVLDALGNGCHVLCQKPFAPSLDEALALKNAAENAGLLLSINENWRWRSWYRELKNILSSNTIGKPNYLYMKRHNCTTLPNELGGNPALLVKQPYTQDLPQLIMFEWGIHLVDVARFLFGDPQSVFASAQKINTLFKGEDRFILQVRFSGLDAVLDISWATISKSEHFSQLEHVVVEGDCGTVRLLDYPEEVIRLETRDEEILKPAIPVSNEYAYQDSYTQAHRHFINCLRRGEYPETYAGDNLKTLALVFAAYESVRRNQVVDFAAFIKEKGCHG